MHPWGEHGLPYPWGSTAGMICSISEHTHWLEGHSGALDCPPWYLTLTYALPGVAQLVSICLMSCLSTFEAGPDWFCPPFSKTFWAGTWLSDWALAYHAWGLSLILGTTISKQEQKTLLPSHSCHGNLHSASLLSSAAEESRDWTDTLPSYAATAATM